MRRRRVIAVVTLVYVLACLALGWATTLFFNHYIGYAWRFDPEPDRARRWGMEIADATITVKSSPEGSVRVGRAWLESGHPRRFTMALIPYPDVFFMNRYSVKLHHEAVFRALHVTLDAEGQDSLDLVDVPEAAKLSCGGDVGVPGRFYCAIWAPDATRTTFRGRIPGGEFELTLGPASAAGKP